MKVLVRLTVPNYIYRFYNDSAQCIRDASAESVMADALSAYAGLLSEDIARKRELEEQTAEGVNSSSSRSR